MGTSNADVNSSSTKSLASMSGSSSNYTVQNETTNGSPPAEMMSYCRRYLSVAILFLVNLLNYMDRSTIAGVLGDVQHEFVIGDGQAGLLQSIFVVGFAATAPIFGYLGDRYNRKWLMVGGIGLWSVVTLCGSFVPADQFWLFVLLRGVVGVGEASYVTIAPTLISDMFVDRKRSLMLMIFYYAIPVGSGMGYIVGANVAKAFDDWRYSFRLTPGLGVLCCLLIIFVTQDPPRGMAEDGANHRSNSTLKEDLIALLKNKTFMLSTAGNTCVTFVAGALALFAPKFLYDAYLVSGDYTTPSEMVSLYTGIITVVAGFLGVALGTIVAAKVKEKYKNGDPLVCAFGIMTSTPFLYATLVLCEYYMIPTWCVVLIGQILLFMNWPLVADILLYTVPATLRSSAGALQLFICHILGDAFSPLLLGSLSDVMRGSRTSGYAHFQSLQYSLFVTLFVTVLGGAFFLACSVFIVKDKNAAEAATKATAVRSPPQVERPIQTLPLDDMVPLLDNDMTLEDDTDDVLILPT